MKNFNCFVNEVLTLKRTGGSHYLERVNTRLSQLEIIKFVNNKDEEVKASSEDLIKAQTFFRKALSNLADSNKSKIFSDVDIPPYNIGIIRLGLPKVILSNGEEVSPIFKVYERTDLANGKEIFRTGKCFWLFTLGSQVLTIKLYNVYGKTKHEKAILIEKSISHIRSSRSAELAKIDRFLSPTLGSIDTPDKFHKIILNPSGISTVSLDLTSDDTESQLEAVINSSTAIKKEKAYLIPDPDSRPSFDLEMIPKQMNVTPGKIWLLERNDKFNTWGAMPILQSKQIKGLTGNEIQIKLGKKWLHWLKEPMFNTPLQIDRIIKKGDTVSLAKEIGRGEWLINTGTVTDIATDSRSNEYPYVKTNGWDSSVIIDRETAKKIFVDSRQINEANLLDFSQWISLNFQ